MVDVSIAINAANLLKDLKKVKRSIPKITSRAMQLSSEQARDDARASAKRKLDRPRPATLKAIRNRWPSRGAVIGGNANASVYIADFLEDEILPNVYGGIENRVPKSNKSRLVIVPGSALKLNKFGNISGLRSLKGAGKLKRFIEDKTNYLEVPLRGGSKATKHLHPGIYKFERRRKKLTGKLIMMVIYEPARITNPKWREYPKVVRNSFDRTYEDLWIKGYTRELRKLL